jgi:hypothetical protein
MSGGADQQHRRERDQERSAGGGELEVIGADPLQHPRERAGGDFHHDVLVQPCP